MSATLLPLSAWRKARKICSSVCPFLRHRRVLLDLVHRTTLAAPNSTYPWLAFRVLGHSSGRRLAPGSPRGTEDGRAGCKDCKSVSHAKVFRYVLVASLPGPRYACVPAPRTRVP